MNLIVIQIIITISQVIILIVTIIASVKVLTVVLLVPTMIIYLITFQITITMTSIIVLIVTVTAIIHLVVILTLSLRVAYLLGHKILSLFPRGLPSKPQDLCYFQKTTFTVAEFTFDFLKFDKIFFHALKTTCQLDFRFRRY